MASLASTWDLLLKKKLSWVLLPISLAYLVITKIRLSLYLSGILNRYSPSVLTICVGNISIGGNGKTPVTLYLAQELNRHGKKVSVLTRGYGGKISSSPHLVSSSDVVELIGDEAAVYQNSLKDQKTPVVISPNRAKGALLLSSLGTEVVLLDDGLQHLKIKPSISLCLIDLDESLEYLNPSVLSIFPSGILRELPCSGLRRADKVVFIKREALSEKDHDNLSQIVKKYSIKNYSILMIKPNKILDSFAYIEKDTSTSKLPVSGSEVVSLSSIAKPLSFINNLKSLGLNIIHSYQFPDHHQFREAEFQKIISAHPDKPIICTLKDLVKIKPWIKQEGRIFYLTQEIEDLSPRGQNLVDWIQAYK